MAIYEVGTTELRPVEGTSFGNAGLRERTDLQRLLRDHVEAVSPDTLVISEEFGEWTDSRRRIDLLGIDKEANLVVIELKRSDDGGHMELQAIRYAAMVSTLTSQRAVEIFGKYLEDRGTDEDGHRRRLPPANKKKDPGYAGICRDIVGYSGMRPPASPPNDRRCATACWCGLHGDRPTKLWIKTFDPSNGLQTSVSGGFGVVEIGGISGRVHDG